eukprot:g5152.t1
MAAIMAAPFPRRLLLLARASSTKASFITPRATDYSKWYTDVVREARLVDSSPVKGCMVIRPDGYSLWERIRAELDRRITAEPLGAQNAYFP